MVAAPPRALTVASRMQQQLPPIIVWLNGIEQHFVTAYDCNLRWLERIERDPFGRAVRADDGLSMEQCYGVVTVAYG